MNSALNPFSMQDRLVLVVGGTRGIGRAITLQLARSGATVIANYVRDRASADSLVAEAQSAGLPVEVVRADVTSDKGKELLMSTFSERNPPLSSLVFAAATGIHRPFEEFTARHFDFTFDLNTKTFLSLVQAVVPLMKPGATIVAVSSEGAVRAMPHYGLVGASKAALESLARHLATELAGRGIRVNTLSPGTTQTDVWKVMPDAETRLAEAAASSPKGRLNTVEEIAMAAQFLASDASAGVVGHTLVVDGGSRIVGSC
jgi:enoyl-[acyl-carrier protein] reductase III